MAEDVIAQSAASYPASATGTARISPTQRKYIDIPIYQYGGWYDIFNEGNVRNFMYLQHEGAKGARGNQKLEMGPFGHGPLSGDMEYPTAAASAMRRAGPTRDALVGLLAQGRRQRHHGRAAGEGLHDGVGAQGRCLAKNRWMTFGDWPPAPATVNYFLGADGSLSTTKPAEASASKTYAFDPKNPVQTIGGANLTFDRGPMDQRPIGKRRRLSAVRDAGARQGCGDRGHGDDGPVGVDGRAGYRLHGEAGGRLSGRIRGHRAR